MKSKLVRGRVLNWRPSLKHIAVEHYKLAEVLLPTVIDLRDKMPAVYDQGDMGSCSGNALAGAMQYLKPEMGLPSRLFIYWNEREVEGDPSEDAGATTLLDGCNSLMLKGVCPETDWAYLDDNLLKKPSEQAFSDALNYKISSFMRATNILGIQEILAQGSPVSCGIPIYESFMAPDVGMTGYVPIPKPDEQLLGGHALLIVGYNKNDQAFIVRNSWGSGWGDAGHAHIPFSYIDQLGSDFFSIR